MSIFGKVGRVVAYPLLKPLGQARDAAVQIKADVDKLKEAKAKVLANQEAQARGYLAGHSEETAEQLLHPELIKDPARRFEVLVSMREWSEVDLEEQHLAVRRGKRFASVCSVVLVVGGLAMLIMGQPLMKIFIVPCLFTGCALAIANAFKYGLYQFQLERRSILSGQVYASQPDFFKHLVW